MAYAWSEAMAHMEISRMHLTRMSSASSSTATVLILWLFILGHGSAWPREVVKMIGTRFRHLSWALLHAQPVCIAMATPRTMGPF